MRVFVRSPIGGESKELLTAFADERIARLVAEHLIRGSLVVPPTGDVEHVIEMAREAARIGRLLMSEQVRSVAYTLEEREAVVLYWPPTAQPLTPAITFSRYFQSSAALIGASSPPTLV